MLQNHGLAARSLLGIRVTEVNRFVGLPHFFLKLSQQFLSPHGKESAICPNFRSLQDEKRGSNRRFLIQLSNHQKTSRRFLDERVGTES